MLQGIALNSDSHTAQRTRAQHTVVRHALSVITSYVCVSDRDGEGMECSVGG